MRPEEALRQQLLHTMVVDLGFPKGLIAVERALSTGRRFDVVCYRVVQEGVAPLLLIECKAGTIDEKAARQAWGYNDELRAPFLCLAGKNGVWTMWQEKEGLKVVPFLPRYEDLIRCV
jgi:hypothetical protein